MYFSYFCRRREWFNEFRKSWQFRKWMDNIQQGHNTCFEAVSNIAHFTTHTRHWKIWNHQQKYPMKLWNRQWWCTMSCHSRNVYLFRYVINYFLSKVMYILSDLNVYFFCLQQRLLGNVHFCCWGVDKCFNLINSKTYISTLREKKINTNRKQSKCFKMSLIHVHLWIASS